MQISKELNKGFIVTLIILIVISLAVYVTYGYLNIGYRLVLPKNIQNILQYLLCGLSILQLMAFYNLIEKAFFDPKTVKKLSENLEEDKEKLLNNYSAEEVTIIKSCKLAFDQNYTFIVYGITLAFIGMDTVTFSSFFLLGLLILCITWFRVNSKVKKYFSSKN